MGGNSALETAIDEIAGKQAVINEKLKIIETLEIQEKELIERVEGYKKNAETLSKENQDLIRKNEAISERSKKDIETTRESVGEELKKLETEKAEIKALRERLETEKSDLALLKASNEKAVSENAQLEAEIESKRKEAKRLGESRSAELKLIQDEKQTLIIEQKKNKVLLDEIESKSAESKKILSRIKEAQDSVASTQADLQLDLALSEQNRQNAMKAQQDAEYSKTLAQTLQTVFRQALHNFIQINGTTIAIPELTEDHKRFVAHSLLAEIGELPTPTTAPETPKVEAPKEEKPTAPETPKVEAK